MRKYCGEPQANPSSASGNKERRPEVEGRLVLSQTARKWRYAR